MKNIDGLVSKDSLYRLMSKLRLQLVITEEQARIICEEIADMPFDKEQIIFPRGVNRLGYLKDYEFELRKVHEDDK